MAVGAPYENDIGAVYIYTTYREKPQFNLIYKITPSGTGGVQKPGFGLSISNGMDIDNNKFSGRLIL